MNITRYMTVFILGANALVNLFLSDWTETLAWAVASSSYLMYILERGDECPKKQD